MQMDNVFHTVGINCTVMLAQRVSASACIYKFCDKLSPHIRIRDSLSLNMHTDKNIKLDIVRCKSEYMHVCRTSVHIWIFMTCMHGKPYVASGAIFPDTAF